MTKNRKIDIRKIDWPMSILSCKKELNQMKQGDQMEILVKDNDVVDNLLALVRQIPGHEVKTHKSKESIRLTVRKKMIRARQNQKPEESN